MFEQLLARIAAAFDAGRIPYMVIGGQAVLVHGEPRLTRDIDVTLGVSTDRLDDVLAVVRHARLEPLVDPETFTRETMVLPCRDGESTIRVDLVFSDSEYERQAIRRSQPMQLGGRVVRFATAEDLVVHKVVAGRPRDLEDVRGILLKQPGLDRALVQRCLADFGTLLGEPLVERFEQLAREA